jgi:hypothetical protein
MRRTIMLVVVALVMAAAIAPGVNAAPKKPPPENFGGSENSTEHRSNESGKGNFGQCHRQGFVEGNASSTFSPSEQNTGEADCRVAGDQAAAAIAECSPPLEPGTESQLTFHPSPGESANTICT